MISERSYRIGERQTAAVGDAVVKVQQFVTKIKPVKEVRANEDFRLRGGGYDLRFTKDQLLDVTDTRDLDGHVYFLVPVETSQLGMAGILTLQVAEDGRIHKKAFDGGFLFSYRPDPPSGRLTPVRESEVAQDKPFSNYEIIFTGYDGNAVHLVYREYSPENLARTAFFQELTYPAGAKTIRFRNLVLDVETVDAEAIAYKVVAD
ncbi:MAG TPA: hypothetical protein VF138_00820 [Caulobacteraceae bacterium]